jgi:hypothetical protein
MFLQNIGFYLQVHVALQPRSSTSSPLSDPKIITLQFCILQTRPLLTAENEDSVSQLPHSAPGNVIDKTSLHEIPPPTENRPNLLGARPHFGNIIALSEVTKPEDRYSYYISTKTIPILLHM